VAILSVGISFELDQDEKVIQETFFCPIEFKKQDDFTRALFGEKGRTICKPYLTNNRILIWLMVIPEKKELDPKAVWYTLPYENVSYMRPGKHGKINRKGLEIEFAAPKVGGAIAGIGKSMVDKGGIKGWVGAKLAKEKMKMWLYVPDFPVWNLTITKILQEKGIVT